MRASLKPFAKRQSHVHKPLNGGAAPRSVLGTAAAASAARFGGGRRRLGIGAAHCSTSNSKVIETSCNGGGSSSGGGFIGGRRKRTGGDDNGGEPLPSSTTAAATAMLLRALVAAWPLLLLAPGPAAAAAASAEPPALPWGLQGIVAGWGTSDEPSARRRRQKQQQKQRRRNGSSSDGDSELAALCSAMVDLWRPTLANMGVSGAMGALSAAALKAAGRALAAGLGVAFVGLQVLTYTGVATVDWTRVHEAARRVLDATGDGRLDADEAKRALKRGAVVLSQGLPSTAGFAAGFLFGLRVF
jgi:uncharacterized membrane protein (Fun14 family)